MESSINWSETEKCHCVQLINDRYDDLFSKFKGASTGAKDKELQWQRIVDSLNSSGLTQCLRNTKQVKTMYKNLKFKVKSKSDAAKQTGGGPAQNFSKAEAMVLDRLKDKPQLNGIIGGIESGAGDTGTDNDELKDGHNNSSIDTEAPRSAAPTAPEKSDKSSDTPGCSSGQKIRRKRARDSDDTEIVDIEKKRGLLEIEVLKQQLDQDKAIFLLKKQLLQSQIDQIMSNPSIFTPNNEM